MSSEAGSIVLQSHFSNGWRVYRGEVVCEGFKCERMRFGAMRGCARLAVVLTGADSFSFFHYREPTW